MSWHFWMIPLVIFLTIRFSRRWQYYGRLHRKRRRREAAVPEQGQAVTSELEDQRSYIANLESRVAELENRLDFTERLLSTRHASNSTV